MLFFRGRDHTIVAAMTERSKHSQLVIHHGEEQELKQETTAVPTCYMPVCFLKKHNTRNAVWFTKATVHWKFLHFC